MTSRRKSRELPDLRPKVHRFPEPPNNNGQQPTPPTRAKIESIAIRHGFPPSCDLVSEIERRWEWWRGDVQKGADPPATVHKKFLVEMAKRAKALEDAIERAGIVERRAIFDSVARHNLDLQLLERQLKWLRRGATAGARTVPPSRSGARGDPTLLNLLCQLFRIYTTAFGANAQRITKTDKYSGPFFDFTFDVLREFGVQKSNQALGKAIEKAIAAVDLAIAEGRLSPQYP